MQSNEENYINEEKYIHVNTGLRLKSLCIAPVSKYPITQWPDRQLL